MESIKKIPYKLYLSTHVIFSWIGILLPLSIYFYFVYFYSLNLPFADDFTNLSQAISIFQSTNFNEAFSIVFVLENGHRIAFTRLIYILSHALSGEIDFKILILIGNISLVVLLCLFFNVLKVPRSNLLYFIPISILLFQLQFWKNMTWAASSIQHQYILLFTGLTFYFLSKKSNPSSYTAFFFAIVSIFTHAGGWVTIFLGWLILLIHKKYRQSSIWAVSSLLLGFFYFKNFHSTTNIFYGIQSFEGFKNFLMFYSAFLGSALSPLNIYIAVGFGIILSFYLCYLTCDKYFERNITVFMFMVYIFLNAIMVAMARSDLGVENVFAPRYKVVSVTLIILVYMSLAERFSSSINKFRGFVAIGILISAFIYFITFKPGKINLETKNKSLRWLTNQWVNTNHGFFYTPGSPGVNDKTPNSILLRALDNKFYTLPHEILKIPDHGYSSSVSLPKTCAPEKHKAFNAKFSVIQIGPESNPYLVRLEGMIHSPIANGKENKPTVHLILKSRKSNYIFETHPQQYLKGSVFFDDNFSNVGFIALLPFGKMESGLYRIGFCYGESIHFEDKVLSVE
jgi:hypothetical protein